MAPREVPRWPQCSVYTQGSGVPLAQQFTILNYNMSYWAQIAETLMGMSEVEADHLLLKQIPRATDRRMFHTKPFLTLH